MELRQLRYFVTLAEELHFGRAAAREHIVQSALSQQIRRLERELQVVLFIRTTHHVRLSPAGISLLADTRKILGEIEQSVVNAQSAMEGYATLRVGIGDPSTDTMPHILAAFQQCHPDMAIHRIEAGVLEQERMLVNGQLDIGIGGAHARHDGIEHELIRTDPLFLLVSQAHHFADTVVPFAELDGELLVLAEYGQAREFREFVLGLCHSLGISPRLYPGTTASYTAAAHLVARSVCVAVLPRSCTAVWPGTSVASLVEPTTNYPWSLMWHADRHTEQVDSVLTCARKLASDNYWVVGEKRNGFHGALGEFG